MVQKEVEGLGKKMTDEMALVFAQQEAKLSYKVASDSIFVTFKLDKSKCF